MQIRTVGFVLMGGALVWQSIWIGNAFVGIDFGPSWVWLAFGLGVGMATTSQEQWIKMRDSYMKLVNQEAKYLTFLNSGDRDD